MNSRFRLPMLAPMSIGLGITMCALAHAEEFEQHAAHEHGSITLNVAVEKQELAIALEAPAVNVVGFEHPPRTEQEKTAVAKAAAVLESGAGLFGMPAEARCRLTAVHVTPPRWDESSEPHDEHEQEGGHENHAGYEARFTYRCEVPQQLSWLEPWLLEKLRTVRDARVNVITAGGQRSQVVRRARERVSLRPARP